MSFAVRCRRGRGAWLETPYGLSATSGLSGGQTDVEHQSLYILVIFYAGNILNFAIALHRLSSSEHEAHPSINLGEIRTAYASGIGLRQLARNMNIPAGTVLCTLKTRRMDPADSAGKADRPA